MNKEARIAVRRDIRRRGQADAFEYQRIKSKAERDLKVLLLQRIEDCAIDVIYDDDYTAVVRMADVVAIFEAT